MVSRRDYNERMVQAAHSVMLELAHLLGEYGDGIVIVGGWVPPLILPQAPERHIGSIDVDLALDHQLLQEPGYETIRRKLERRGYRRDDGQPFIYFRDVTLGAETITVEVDLLAGEYEGTGKGRRTQKVQDARARKARGCDLVFSMEEEVVIEGTRPDGYQDSVRVKVAGMVPFLVMKGMALADRESEKDAYDIVYVLKNFPGGLNALAGKFLPHLSHTLVREGIKKISDKFASPDHIGPGFVADFLEEIDPEARELIRRDAFERVDAFLRGLNFPFITDQGPTRLSGSV